MIRSSHRLLKAATSAVCQEIPKWDIYASVAICRLPIIAPEMNSIQKRFAEMQTEIEHQNSYMSDFELRQRKDEELLKKKKQLELEGKDLSLLEGELGVTAMMEEEEWMKKKKTAYDTYKISRSAFEDNNNKRILSRMFDRKLMLIVRQRFNNTSKEYSSPWILPQLKNEGEPLHETVQRCLGELFTGNTKISIYGKAPSCHVTYKYPKKLLPNITSEATGGKIFIYQCFLDDQRSDIKINDKLISDYQWCTLEEVAQTMDKGSPYLQQINHLLIE